MENDGYFHQCTQCNKYSANDSLCPHCGKIYTVDTPVFFHQSIISMKYGRDQDLKEIVKSKDQEIAELKAELNKLTEAVFGVKGMYK